MERVQLSKICQMRSLKLLEFHQPHRNSSSKVDYRSLIYYSQIPPVLDYIASSNLVLFILTSREITEGHGGESNQLWNKRWLQTHDDWKAGKAFYIRDISDV